MSLLNRNCREVTRLLLERENRRLGPIEWIAVRFHLRICLMCTRFTGQLRLMDRAMAHWKAYADEGEAPDTGPGPDDERR